MIDYPAMPPADAEFARRHLRLTEHRPPKGWVTEGRPKLSEPERRFSLAVVAPCRAGLISQVVYQPPGFELDGNTTYQPDFLLIMPDYRKIYVETKGRRMTSESLTRMKLRQCSERYPEHAWWLARWAPRLPWKVQAVERGVIRKALHVEWLI